VIVYVLEAAAIYRQGVVGVYNTVFEAVEAAEEIWPTTDGHHGFVVTPYELGRTHPDVFERSLFEHFVDPDSIARIEVKEQIGGEE
jgi:hypothetical protein